ncbi:MAG: response regulator transcription factor [Anaerolineae bacterium]|jgi:two-component system KDP operon response regulator KdpE
MGQTRAAQVLVVDDEAVTRVSLLDALRLEGYVVATAASGEEAMSLIKKRGPFDLVILDLKMPGMDGLEVAERIRATSSGTVVILLTAFGTMETAIEAVRKGAHDYLLKPCPIPEILESVREGLSKHREARKRLELVKQLRDTVTQLDAMEGEEDRKDPGVREPERFLRVRDIVIDRQRHVAKRQGEPLDLTPTEFKVLSCLMETPDEVWSPKDLVQRARGYETDTEGARAIIRVHIRRLRKKLEPDSGDPTYVLNVRGVGYLFSSGSQSDE